MELREFGLTASSDWASLVFIRVLSGVKLTREQLLGWEKHDEKSELVGYVLVIDPKFGARAKYKMPGGHKQNNETPLETAVREMEGETGIVAAPEALRYAGKYLSWRKDHWKCIFIATISEADRNWMNDHHPGNEGEKLAFLTIDEFYVARRANKILSEHYDKLVELGIILPLGRDQAAAYS